MSVRIACTFGKCCEKAVADGTPVSGKVTNKIKGGLTVDIGVIAFLPSSQVETRPVHNLDSYLGKEIEVKVLKLNKRRGNAVVSRRGLLEQAAESRKTEALATIQEGGTVTGTIKNLTDYGAFVDLGGIDGLLHVSDLSYGNVTHPSAIVHVGDQVTLKVLKFDREKERISLGLKQLRPDPWLDIDARYPQQSKVLGRVVSVTDYGAFVELEPGVEGLIHISEMTWDQQLGAVYAGRLNHRIAQGHWGRTVTPRRYFVAEHPFHRDRGPQRLVGVNRIRTQRVPCVGIEVFKSDPGLGVEGYDVGLAGCRTAHGIVRAADVDAVPFIAEIDRARGVRANQVPIGLPPSPHEQKRIPSPSLRMISLFLIRSFPVWG